ncbi:MAG: hypothetical protein ACOVP6_07515 [Lacibacter sp.]
MLQKIFYILVAIFILSYFLRSVLMVGYDHLKFKSKRENAGLFFKDLLLVMISLKPVTQRLLTPKGYDFKLHRRFQNKFTLYYVVIWISLFLILFLTAKLYLNIF